MTSGGPRRSALRVIAVIGLLSASFFAALPVLGCGWNPVHRALDPTMLGYRTFGFGVPPLPARGLPGFTGPNWGYAIVSTAYLAAALCVAVRKGS